MNGNPYKTRLRFLSALTFLVFLALPRPPAIGAEVAILLSDAEQAYELPLSAFKQEVGLPVTTYSLKGNIKNAPAVMDRIFASRPALIFALGAKAAYTAKIWTVDHQEVPVLFAMVINWQRYQLTQGQINVAGIASDISPGTQFANMSIFLPDVKKIGVIYSEAHSEQLVHDAKEAVKLLDIELIAKPIARPEDFKRIYREFGSDIDGYWVLADPVIYTMENISWLEKKCITDKLACIGQSENIARFGMLLAVDPDPHSIGSQAASMARSILENKLSPKELGVRLPLGTKIYLNQATAQKTGHRISPGAADMASEIIDKP